MLCQKIIPLKTDAHGRLQSNTYCMRPANHEGKCAQEPAPEDKEGGAQCQIPVTT